MAYGAESNDGPIYLQYSMIGEAAGHFEYLQPVPAYEACRPNAESTCIYISDSPKPTDLNKEVSPDSQFNPTEKMQPEPYRNLIEEVLQRAHPEEGNGIQKELHFLPHQP